jgi:ATP-binding cassette, subfamily A (ABC1), member 3
MKAEVPDRRDEDYLETMNKLAATKGGVHVDEENAEIPDVIFSYDEVIEALNVLGDQDGSLSAMIRADDPIGYNIYKDSTSPVGVTLVSLATWATTELRMRRIEAFLVQRFPAHVLRERQDTKVRYEVSNDGVRLSAIFSSIEEYKERLHLDDYGVSQTSLEQVFNMHAAEAERLKQGRDEH